MRNIVTGLILSLVVYTQAAFAATINVPADQPTIQAGINAAVTGDTVLVAPGTYVENINFMGKAITVKSSGGAKVTIIDGGAAAPVAAFVTQEGTTSVLGGFTLQNGVGTFQFGYQGGGVSISNASPTIKDNVIINNTAGDGGGVGVSFGSPVMMGNTITRNSAQFGGGVAFVGASSAQMVRNTISRNTAGAGAAIELFAAANVFIANNKIVNNGPAGQGGGFYIVNEADEIIVENVIADNTASSGSQIYSLIPQSAKGFALINNTIVSAPNGGADAAIIADGFNTNVLIENNIISAVGDNAALLCNPIYVDGPPIVEFNDAFNPKISYGDSCSGFDGMNGNISNDPLFLNIAKHMYELTAASPVIDMGSNSAPDLPKKDFAGNPRIVDGNGDGSKIIDMGAYEFQ
jgi:hypothetical protein